MKEFKQIISRASEDIGIILTDREIERLTTYHRELLFWNEKMSLISIKSPLDVPKHFIDSLTAVECIKNEHARLLDIGTGAGLPGIPLKIKMESLTVTLMDSSRKKTSFLKGVIRKLGLNDIFVVNRRAESLTDDKHYRESFDVVISRAAFKIPYLLTLGSSFLSEGGTLVAMKGKNANVELEESANAVRETGFALSDYHEIKLPVTGELRKILCFNKISL